MQKGSIGVTSDNIFPVIKKFLYSDHEIFLREIVSNAVDATQKMKTLASVGEFKGELGDLTVRVKIDKDNGTLTISDRGIGMTEDEINKYINQIAFSGAEEFVNKYKDNAQAIIGHFGLGFYSSFMVSKKVEIHTLSYKEGAKAVCWSCDGSPEFEMKEIEKSERGTDIVLFIDDENKEFLEDARINTLLNKYCKFLPVEIAFGKETEWKDGKNVETDKDKIINNTKPAWTKKPSELKDEDYDNFYRELYPMSEPALFHIHLNADEPFKLTGILYFPKIKNNFEIQKNKIQLYCNQVFVTDSVECIVPEFLTLLHGVIDSPDIPLNVSRSYLQSDANVKKISGYITKKVADKLMEIFKKDRTQFEEKWDNMKLFIQYGMLSEEKFYEKAKDFALLKNTEGKYYTLEEYKKLIESEQTDKDGNLIYLYATNKEDQYSFIERAKAKGYDVILADGQLDIHAFSQLEQKNEKTRFVRVDSDVVEKLILKSDDSNKANLSDEQQSAMTTVFRSQLPQIEKTEFIVSFENMPNAAPIVITQNEFMRRMKDMSAMYGNNMMSFYGEMPNSYNLVVNVAHPLVDGILKDEEKQCDGKTAALFNDIKAAESRISELKKSHEGKKEDEKPVAEKEEIDNLNKKVGELRKQIDDIVSKYAAENKHVRQLIDLSLLENNMLKGEALSNFVKRSIELL
ncbi:MAG: molecular chaperone HtpG [Paludibacteraceae bacterium]|nr:molecular chaperone HtpG [Paludibacteraceae bacterium]